MKSYFKYIFIVLTVFFSYYLSAQKEIELQTISASFPPESALSEEDRNKIVEAVEELLKEYAEAATLIDPKKKRVNSESIDRFRELFNAVARIPKDFEEYVQPELIDVRKYTEGVYQRLPLQGVRLVIGKTVLSKIEDDPAGFWVAEVEVEKMFYNAVAADMSIKNFTSPRTLDQVFRIDIRKANLDRIKIGRISSKGPVTIPDKYVQYFGPSIGFNVPFFSPTMSGYWESNHASGSSFDVNGSLSFSGGVDFSTNQFFPAKAFRKDLFLTGGLHFSYMRLVTELSDFSIAASSAIAEDAEGDEISFTRVGGPIAAEEKLNISLLEIPLGVSYRVKEDIKSSIFISAKLVPTLILNGSGSVSGTGDYDAILPEAMWRLLEDKAVNPNLIDNPNAFGPFNGGQGQVIDQSANPSLNGFLLGLRVSPLMYFNLSEDDESWSLLAGIDFNLPIGSFIDHQPAESDIFRFTDDYETSLLEHYTDDLSSFSIGFRIGLHRRLTRKP